MLYNVNKLKKLHLDSGLSLLNLAFIRLRYHWLANHNRIRE